MLLDLNNKTAERRSIIVKVEDRLATAPAARGCAQ
jgi:hypothetical protein